jgi:hypothetical protein
MTAAEARAHILARRASGCSVGRGASDAPATFDLA